MGYKVAQIIFCDSRNCRFSRQTAHVCVCVRMCVCVCVWVKERARVSMHLLSGVVPLCCLGMRSFLFGTHKALRRWLHKIKEYWTTTTTTTTTMLGERMQPLLSSETTLGLLVLLRSTTQVSPFGCQSDLGVNYKKESTKCEMVIPPPHCDLTPPPWPTRTTTPTT
jgi:hypothetical protein